MRTGRGCLVASCIALLACTAPVPTRTTYKAGMNHTGDDSESGMSATPNDSEDPTETPSEENPPDSTNPENPDPGMPPPLQGDADADGIADAEDCDPASPAVIGTKLLDDDLGTQKGLFAAAPGFPAGSWSHDGTAYRQGRLADASDTALLTKDAAVGDAILEVRSASTEITGITPTLRQIFVLFGATTTGGKLDAVGCGVEVVGGEAVTQKTSVVRLSGAPSAVTTSVLQRVDRTAVQVNEEFTIKARLAKGTLTCDVTNGGKVTTATATGLNNVTGSVGFFTRQTKALFKQARFCKLK